VIVKVPRARRKWWLYARDGRVLGRHASERDAMAQERAINIAKARRAGHRIPLVAPRRRQPRGGR
jgi:hypothetical protein